MSALRDADRVLGHSYADELYEPRPAYVPYEPNPWRVAVQLVADVTFMGGFLFGLPLALAGSPYQVVAIVCLLLGLTLDGVAHLMREER